MPHLLLLLLALGLASASPDIPPIKSYPKDQVHLFLLAGQSNMAGRGELNPESDPIHPRIFALSEDGTWVPAQHPIHYDKPIAGVGLAKSFALRLVEEDPDLVIGLIPTACGGSPISSWEPGGYHKGTQSHPYDDAMARTARARKDGTLKAILWHQGEADSKPGLASKYQDRLQQLILRFRQELDLAELPFIMGQLGQFPENPWDEFKHRVNAAHITLAEKMEAVAFVPSDQLTSKPDNIHFNTESLREFGRRYAQAYLKVKRE